MFCDAFLRRRRRSRSRRALGLRLRRTADVGLSAVIIRRLPFCNTRYFCARARVRKITEASHAKHPQRRVTCVQKARHFLALYNYLNLRSARRVSCVVRRTVFEYVVQIFSRTSEHSNTPSRQMCFSIHSQQQQLCIPTTPVMSVKSSTHTRNPSRRSSCDVRPPLPRTPRKQRRNA